MRDAARQPTATAHGWHFWIDRGGTFTDVVGCDPQGGLHSLKLLSESPERYADAAVEGIRRCLAGSPPDERRVAAVRMGTTVGTNALLERRGEPTVLIATAGLEDALRIGTQQRPDLFALDIRLPEMLYAEVVGARERIAAGGDVIVALDEARLAADLAAVRARGIDSAAVVFMHGYRYPQHERRAGEIAASAGFSQVSLSHETLPLMKLVPRGDTTLVDAYLSPVLRRYVASLREGLDALTGGGVPLLFMQSHGGLAGAEFFRGRDSILSGPAGGVIGMSHTAVAAGFERVLGFDMGGTSTDVSLYAGELERTGGETVAGVRIAAPMLRIHTVAAGGGSRVAFASGRLQVGPESAGADPGPACYRRGGPPTVTDANVVLGRIRPEFFPRDFGADGKQSIDVDAAREAFAGLAAEMSRATGVVHDTETVAAGAVRIAVELMANAIKRISIERGFDVADFTLASFGGAGGQHACGVADALGVDAIFIHPLAGVLSAYGMGLADLRTLRQRAVERPLDAETVAAMDALLMALAAEAKHDLTKQGVPPSAVTTSSRAGLKAEGSDTTLPVGWRRGRPPDEAIAEFAAAHVRHFGFDAPGRTVIVEWIEVEGIGAAPRNRVEPPGTEAPAPTTTPDGDVQAPVAEYRVWFEAGCLDAPVYERDKLRSGSPPVIGPALIVEAHATTVVEKRWQAVVGETGHLMLTRVEARPAKEHIAAHADPILLEVFNHAFVHIAEQMGATLQSTAQSINIKERLDFSCAVFDAGGDLIANAPHVPVHLGSMGDSVRKVLDVFTASLKPGDVFVLNAPYDGGTHLPDITVVTPVFLTREVEPRFMVASRAHHADIGGITPGSMPPMSTSIHEEGIVIDCMPIVSQGRFLYEEVRALLLGGPHPVRNVEQNIADLKAQIAANARGAAELAKLVGRYGPVVVSAYMQHVKANAEECVRVAIENLGSGRWSAEFDSGERVVVSVTVDAAKREACVDFTGTSPTSRGNLNAPASIARAAILYVFRTLVKQNIPLNAGCMRPLTVVLPAHTLVNPEYPAAVVAGNVETSQCITDALLAALGAAAASQGTMNNFTFGDERHQYYETLCGGAGAGPGFHGASAVHTHMTNSRLTDPEVLEWRYPVRIRRFEIRRGSGGEGMYRGGDGVVRDLEFLEPMHAAILSNRRRVRPFGLRGGGDAAPGRNYVLRASGELQELGATAELFLEGGDRFIVETPGGGGYGRPPGGEGGRR